MALPRRTPLHGPGQVVTATLTQPVYQQNRLVLPVGTQVRGPIVTVRGPRPITRIADAVGGDFRPAETAGILFDCLQAPGGEWIGISTQTSLALEPLRLVSTPSPRPGSSVQHGPAQRLDARLRTTVDQGWRDLQSLPRQADWSTLKTEALAGLPYHPLWLPAHTRYAARLTAPVSIPGPGIDWRGIPRKADPIAVAALPTTLPPDLTLYARLDTQLSSATAYWGEPVQATLLRPVFDQNHQLLLPQGAELLGTVLAVQPARWFDRGGRLNFSFTRLRLPSGAERRVAARLRAAAVAAGTKLNQEGVARATTPGGAAPYLALGVSLAFVGAHGDADNAWSLNAGSGTHLRLWGTATAVLLARLRPLALGYGLLGSASTIYRHWIRRGPQMVFPRGSELIIVLAPPPSGRRLPLPLPHSSKSRVGVSRPAVIPDAAFRQEKPHAPSSPLATAPLLSH